jgi:hypothetical protein
MKKEIGDGERGRTMGVTLRHTDYRDKRIIRD